MSGRSTQDDSVTKTITQRISPDEFLTTDELANLLKIKDKKVIYNFIREGMPAILIGKQYRFIRNEVIDFLKQRSKEKIGQMRNSKTEQTKGLGS